LHPTFSLVDKNLYFPAVVGVLNIGAVAINVQRNMVLRDILKEEESGREYKCV
jgi:hypothetical protein